MALAQGHPLSHYTILGPLGAGAMGEVYRARDTKLGREVAIKVLPEHFADDEERLKRFEREAKTLASLNHPNVAQIFGVDQVEDICFLVLELVPGESLEERLRRGPLSIEETLDVCKQIAEGLEAAHDAGVIHRDLKPANVRVTPDGKVKVLDFGLAKTALESSKGSSTDSVLSTEAGRLLGTPTYMAPEQARGKSIDRRVDIWAFGCVLYECLTAKRAFVGETLTDVLGAVLHSHADLGALPPSTPPRVHELLARCFAKDPRARLRDIGEARLLLADPATLTEPARSAGSTARRPVWRSPAVILSASLLAVAIAVTLLGRPPSSDAPSTDRQVIRATLAIPESRSLSGDFRPMAISPDATQVVVRRGTLHLREFSRLDYRALAGTEGATSPFWSPDGQSIAFFSGRELKRIDLAAGIVRVICPAPAGRGGAWSAQGKIVFAPSATGGLSIVDDSGGAAAPITTPATPQEAHRLPQMLPDGRRFLYHAKDGTTDGVYAFDPESQQSRLVVAGETEAVFVEPSSLVFGRDGNLLVQGFDLDRLELTGSPRPLAAGVYWNAHRGGLHMSISPRGPLVYQTVARGAAYKLAWMDRQGVQAPIPVAPLPLTGVSLAPDGRRAVVVFRGERGEAYLAALDLERGIKTSIGDRNVNNYFGAVMSRDGQRIIAPNEHKGAVGFVSFPFGGGQPTLLSESEPGFEQWPTSITPDGRTLIYVRFPLLDKVGQLMTLDLEGQSAPRPFLTTPHDVSDSLISPAGDLVAYFDSIEKGNVLKVTSFPTLSTPVQVSPTNGTRNPGWLSDREIYWMDFSRKVWSASISSKGGELEVGSPKPMFDGVALSEGLRVMAYDIPRERFLIAIEDSPAEEPQLIFVSDWRAEAAPAESVRK